jgi:hypothetical protein
VRTESVLVIALTSDLHADAIVHQLHQLGIRVFRIDPTEDESLPVDIDISAFPYTATYQFSSGDQLNLNSITGVLCRFALESLSPQGFDDPLKHFAQSEQLAALLAPLRGVPQAKWVNDPWAASRADCRIYQAKAAQAVGLRVPVFLVSSRYADLLAFHARYGNVVIKPLSDAPLAEVDGEFVGQEKLRTWNFRAPYTATFAPLPPFQHPRSDDTPSLLQVKLEKRADLRVTVIDDQIFAAEMVSSPDDPIDFRLKSDIRVRHFDFPAETGRQLISLLKALGLRFASCDFVQDESGLIYFLEANVDGNWLWTEAAGLPISQAIAHALIRG